METQLRRAALFRDLDTADLRPFAATAQTTTIGSGEVVFRQGDAAEAFYLIVVGQIRLFRLARDGREKVIEILQAGDTFAEAAVLRGQDLPVTAVAIDDSQLLRIPAATLHAQLQQNPTLATRMLASMSQRVHRFVQDIHALSLASAEQRVAGYLLACVDRDPGQQTVHLPAGKGMIASRLGLQPETFSRVLRKLKHKGVLSEQDGVLIIRSCTELARLCEAID